MTICRRRRVPKVMLCAGDLRHKIRILSREQGQPVEFGDIEPVENFAEIAAPYATIETTKGPQIFAGVNIDDRATHLFGVPYRSIFVGLETGNNYISYAGKYYRILQTTHLDSDRNVVLLQATDRGDDALVATEA